MNFWDDERRKNCQMINNLKYSILEILDIPEMIEMLEKEEIHTNSNHAISARLVYQYRSLFRVCHCNRRLKQSPEVFKPSRVTSTTALAIPCRWHRPAKWCKVLASCTQNGKSRKCHQFLFTTSWIVQRGRGEGDLESPIESLMANALTWHPKIHTCHDSSHEISGAGPTAGFEGCPNAGG